MGISKQINEIRTFSTGIIAKPDDERDAPQNSAVNSLNIEPLADGELRGIPTDLSLKNSGFDTNIGTIYYTQGGITNTNPSASTLSDRATSSPPSGGG